MPPQGMAIPQPFTTPFASSRDGGHVVQAVVVWSGAYALKLPTSVPTMPFALPHILALDRQCLQCMYCPRPRPPPQPLVPAARQ